MNGILMKHDDLYDKVVRVCHGHVNNITMIEEEIRYHDSSHGWPCSDWIFIMIDDGIASVGNDVH